MRAGHIGETGKLKGKRYECTFYTLDFIRHCTISQQQKRENAGICVA